MSFRNAYDLPSPLPVTSLSEDVVSQIESSRMISSLNDVVLSLVKNSLDAQSSKIVVSVEFCHGGCTVEDNGHGISTSDFQIDGGLFKPHCTSKLRSPHTYGKSGMSLFSIAALSLVTVTSRDSANNPTKSMTVQYSNVTAVNSGATSQNNVTIADRGTKVTVRNLFGNFPVRLKQRASADANSNKVANWRKLRRDIIALLLACGRTVDLSILDDDTSEIALSIQSRKLISVPNPFSIHAQYFGLGDTLNILTASSFINPNSWSSWIPLKHITSHFSITGAISLESALTRQCQFISIGIMPLSPSGEHNEIFRRVNVICSKSRFGLGQNAYNASETQSLEYSSNEQNESALDSELPVKRWPMFCLKVIPHGENEGDYVKSPLQMSDIHRLDWLSNILEFVISNWLKKQGFLPQGPKSTPVFGMPLTLDIPRSSKTSNSKVARPLSSNDGIASICDASVEKFSRCKSSDGRLQTWLSSRQTLGSSFSVSEFAKPTNSDRTSKLTPVRANQSSPSMYEGNSQAPNPGYHVPAIIHTQAPKFSVISDSIEGLSSSKANAGTRNKSNHYVRALQAKGLAASEEVITNSNSWVKSTVGEWANPSLKSAEPVIRHLGSEPQEPSEKTRFSKPRLNLGEQCKLSKQSLATATVVSQVDQKFLLVKMVSTGNSNSYGTVNDSCQSTLLAIVDQHAADERCKYEALLRNLCSSVQDPDITRFASALGHSSNVNTKRLPQPISFRISSSERKALEQHASYFSEWGILYNIGNPATIIAKSEDIDVFVISLPPTIYERSLADPELIPKLLRNEIQKCADSDRCLHKQYSFSRGNNCPSSGSMDYEHHHWVIASNNCPEQLLKILQSRACRSAIMFNDNLSLEKCEKLLGTLALCTFPFQCAHGRPSAIPLINLDWIGEKSGRVGIGSIGSLEGNWDSSHSYKRFAHAYKNWRQSTA